MPESAPTKGQSFESIMEDVQDRIMPGKNHFLCHFWLVHSLDASYLYFQSSPSFLSKHGSVILSLAIYSLQKIAK